MTVAVKVQREKESGQGSMFDLHTPVSNELPDVPEWSETVRLAMEKEALGFYITGHPLNKHKEKLEKLSITNTSSLKECQDKDNVNIGGIVMSIKKLTTKKGEAMASLTVEDLFGTIEVIVWPDLYSKSEEMLSQDLPIVIAGYLDKSDRGVKVISKAIASIDNVTSEMLKEAEAPARGQKWGNGNNRRTPAEPKHRSLTLTLSSDTDPGSLERLQEVFKKYSGDCNVYLKIVSPEKWETVLSTDRHVMPSKEMLAEVKDILGEESANLL
jgi:DNA polymerase-3 subunit alpha